MEQLNMDNSYVLYNLTVQFKSIFEPTMTFATHCTSIQKIDTYYYLTDVFHDI